MATRDPRDARDAVRRVEANDDYINKPGDERRLGLPADETADQIAAEGELDVTSDEVLRASHALSRLDWHGGGLNRDEIKARYGALPVGIYLRLPATKKYTSSAEVLHECGLAQARAEGMFEDPNLESEFPEAASVDDGGPPGWGDQSGIYRLGGSVEGGSAEDKEGLIQGE
jgi:hypothetical protein